MYAKEVGYLILHTCVYAKGMDESEKSYGVRISLFNYIILVIQLYFITL